MKTTFYAVFTACMLVALWQSHKNRTDESTFWVALGCVNLVLGLHVKLEEAKK